MATITAKVTPWRAGASNLVLTQAGMSDPNGILMPNGNVTLTSREINAQAAVTVRGTPGERVDFFRFGFIQLKVISGDCAQYRGRTPADGSALFALDRPPARTQQLCRDSYTVGKGTDIPILGPVIFYDGDQAINLLVPVVGEQAGYFPGGTVIPASGSLFFTVDFYDSPGRTFSLIQPNNKFAPARLNYLYLLESSAAFSTMFAVQRGIGAPIEVLKTFQWNVRWHVHFGLDLIGHVQRRPADGDLMDMNVSNVVDGGPIEPQFRNHANDALLPICNAVMDAAYAHPLINTSTKWENWDMRH